MQKVSMVKMALHLEGASVFGIGLYYYALCGFSWTLFFCLFLLPDVGMVGYAVNKKIGALLYNLTHSYIFPIVLLGISLHSNNRDLQSISIIWITHIGMDRMLGYGLKYSTEFFDTHIGRA